jgi:molybdopterin-guanine dinucleotide biosynthesis protein A
MHEMKISGIILAGGKSRRMGHDKAFLALGGQSLIEIVIERVQAVAAEVIVVTNTPLRYAHLATRLVGDIYRGVGTLGGMHAGLTAARHDYALVVGCDMPFLNPLLLTYMASLAPQYDAVVPQVDGLFEPLHAIYSRSCLPLIEDRICARQWEAFSFYPQARVRYFDREEMVRFDPALLSLRNANTPEEWQRVKREFALFADWSITVPRRPVSDRRGL